jgi:hypothetical protein
VPEVLAAGRDRRVLVLEHLTAVADGQPWAVRYATALARRHAVSPGELPADTWRPGDLADACLGWAVQGDALVQRAERRGTDHFARMLRADWTGGTMTARERVTHRLGVAAAAADGRADLAATVRLATAMREALARA